MARATAAPRWPAGSVDPAAPLGVLAAVAVIAAAISLGGQPQAFIDGPSMIIVLGGTLAVTLTSFPLREFVRAPAILADAMSLRPMPTPNAVAIDCVELAAAARSHGLIALERDMARLPHCPVLRRGISLLTDGLDRDTVLPVLRREISHIEDTSLSTQRLLRRAADVAPAMGLIGTLVGLVQMLGQLDDPASIGPSMAVALLTTLYGAFIAHAILIPLAERLAGRTATEQLLLEIQWQGVRALAEKENPRLLETRLNGLLPPAAQLAMFD